MKSKSSEVAARWDLNHPGRRNELKRLWNKKNPDKVRARNRKLRYGLTSGDFDLLLIAQSGRCAICKNVLVEGRNLSGLSVDHDHITGKVRGLLCRGCNVGLGYFKESASVALEAAVYLEKNR